jgi:hypothetical protein
LHGLVLMQHGDCPGLNEAGCKYLANAIKDAVSNA